jgi:hypothetical protein
MISWYTLWSRIAGTKPAPIPWIGGRLAVREHRRCRRLDGDDRDPLHLLAQDLADAGDRPAGADAGDEGVDVLELLQQLLRRGLAVDLRVGGIVELLRHEVVRMFFDQLFRFAHRGMHALAVGRQHQLGAVGHQQAAPLDAHRIRHGEHKAIALHGGDQRQPDAGVAAGRLDDRGAGLQPSVALGGFDHAQTDAILHAAARVHVLELAPHGGMLVADQTVEPYDGRVADQLDRRINDRRPHLRASHQHLIYRKASRQSQFAPPKSPVLPSAPAAPN